MRKILHFAIAHVTPSSSSSMIAYLDSASERNLDPACMSTQLSSFFCWRTKPNPRRLASVQRRVGFCGSKNWSVGADVRDVFAAWNACS